MTGLPNNLDDLIALGLSDEFGNPLAYELARNLEVYRMKVAELVEVHRVASVQTLRENGL